MTEMMEKPFGLLELGSNSLKFYLVTPAPSGGHMLRTHKFPWTVAHDFFSTGSFSPSTLDAVLKTLHKVEEVSEGVPPATMLAVATGVFRELPGITELGTRMKEETGIRLRVISGEDEAKLMAKCLPREESEASILLCDVGGATTEWAWIERGTGKAWGSLPLGAIRNQYRFRGIQGSPSYLGESVRRTDEVLSSLIVPPAGTRIMATGGTAKAAARVTGSDIVSLDELRILIETVLHEGPPPVLRPERQAVFLPGLVILERILVRTGTAALEHALTSVRDGMAERLIQLLGSHRREDLHS
ncbi:MAG TPA: hypothetical protein VMT52_11785, partial [Planctomycetota bacterium]|nr:hypothetical protein [Planctomycetota bacterium]